MASLPKADVRRLELKLTPQSAIGVADKMLWLEKVDMVDKRKRHAFLVKAGVDISASNFSKWINHPETHWGLLKQDNFDNLVNCLVQKFPWLRMFLLEIEMKNVMADPLYYGIAPLMGPSYEDPIGMESSRIDYIKKALVGKYKFWRPTMDKRGGVFVGELRIHQNSKTQAIHATESYKGYGGSEWNMDGRLFAYSRTIYVTITIQPGLGMPQVCYIHAYPIKDSTREGYAIQQMSGFVADMHEEAFYVVPMWFQRIGDKEKVQCEVARRIPSIIKNNLEDNLYSRNFGWIEGKRDRDNRMSRGNKRNPPQQATD